MSSIVYSLCCVPFSELCASSSEGTFHAHFLKLRDEIPSERMAGGSKSYQQFAEVGEISRAFLHVMQKFGCQFEERERERPQERSLRARKLFEGIMLRGSETFGLFGSEIIRRQNTDLWRLPGILVLFAIGYEISKSNRFDCETAVQVSRVLYHEMARLDVFWEPRQCVSPWNFLFCSCARVSS